jgi:hypothetical protein
MSITAATEQPQKVQLYDDSTIKDMTQWYDQQITLAERSKTLSQLKADIAKARAEETYALVQIARLTAPPPAEKDTMGEEKRDPGDTK